jgi:hypothetical protein
MNFMHDVRPCAERFARLADGSIDYQRYEMLARQARNSALRTIIRGVGAAVGHAVAAMRGDRKARLGPASGFREA